jgi:hypothetical protein
LVLTKADLEAAKELGIKFVDGHPVSGVPGITWYPPCNKWRVIVWHKGKPLPSKTFDILDLDGAIAYRQELERQKTASKDGIEAKLGFTIVSEEEKKTSWTKENKPEKYEARKRLFSIAKSRQLRPYELAFDLPGLDFESTKLLVELCLDKDYSRIIGCEDDDVVIRTMEERNPGITLFSGKASETMYGLGVEKKFVFDFIWGDFLGSYCDETERFLENIFRFQLLRAGASLYITLGNAHSKDSWPACQRAMFEFDRTIRFAKLGQEKNMFSIFPATVINMAASHLYVMNLFYQDEYMSGKSTMRVWGFEASKYDTVVDAKLRAEEVLKKIY